METLLRKMSVKYDLNRLNNKKLKEYLNDPERYDEFINNLALVLNSEVGYEFLYLDKLKTIKRSIKSRKETRSLTKDEKNVLKVLSMKDLNLKQKVDFKTQYVYTHLYNLGVPSSLRNEEFYKKVVNSNYENIYRFYDVLNATNAYYKETALSILTGEITTLATVNTILNESDSIDSELFDLLVDISTKKPEKERFDTSRDYHRYKRYQYKTVKQLKTSVNKVKAIDKVEDTEKVLVK